MPGRGFSPPMKSNPMELTYAVPVRSTVMSLKANGERADRSA
jgi:hypothetical protein